LELVGGAGDDLPLQQKGNPAATTCVEAQEELVVKPRAVLDSLMPKYTEAALLGQGQRKRKSTRFDGYPQNQVGGSIHESLTVSTH
jgi:hypothetical protein